MSVLPSPARDHDLVAVQCLRGVAAIIVVAFHCFMQVGRIGYTGNLHMSLSAGVDIFFVISGFIMLFSARRSPGRGSLAFLANRAIRILPIYWLLTTVMVAVAVFAPQVMTSTRYDAWHVTGSYLMFPVLHPVLHRYWPILIPGWTLNCEAFFYLLFAIGLGLTRDRGYRLALIVGGAVVAAVLVPLVVPVAGAATFYTDTVMLEFAFGLAAALAYMRGFRIPLWIGVAAMAIGAGALTATDYLPHPDTRALVYGVPALAIFAGAVFVRWPAGRGGWVIRLLRVLGDASYSIYLTHMITMAAAGQVWRRVLGGGWPGAVAMFVLVIVTVCTLAGILFYHVVERPLTRWLQQQTGRRTVRPAVAVTP